MNTQSIMDTPNEAEMADLQTVIAYINETGKMPGETTTARVEEIAAKYDLDLETILSPSLGMDAALGGLARGGSMGWSDELRGAGAAIMPGGDDYTTARDTSRRKARTQELLKPKTAFGSEIAGAFLPAVGALALTRGRKPGAAAPAGPVGQIVAAGRNLGGAIAAGGLEGAVTAYGHQEGSNNPLNVNTAIGAGLGAAGGLFGHLLGNIGDNARVRSAVTKEVKKLMADFDLNADEVIEQLAKGHGPITTKNQTLLAQVRALYNEAGDKAQKDAWERTGSMARGARERVSDEITPTGVDTAAPAYRAAQTIEDTSENYAGAFAEDAANLARRGGVPEDVTKTVEALANMHPTIVKDINRAARNLYLADGGDITKWTDVVAKGKDGRVTWTRNPTPRELASINKTARDKVTKGFKDVTPGTESLKDVQKAYRARLGQEDVMPAWGGQQALVAAERANKEAYELGLKATTANNAQEAAAKFVDMAPEQQDAFRAGFAEQIKRRMRGTGPTASPLRAYIPNEDGMPSDVSQLARMVFGEEAENLMRGGQGWQELSNSLRTNSWTPELLARQAARKSGGAADMSTAAAIDVAVSGVPGPAMATAATMKGAKSLFNKVIGIRDQKVMNELLNVLTTNNPDVLEAALKGDDGAIRFISQLARDMVSGLGIATGSQGGQNLLQYMEKPDVIPLLDPAN